MVVRNIESEAEVTGVLAGKVALITGAAQGQGRAHAIGFAKEGADVVIVDRCEQDPIVNYEMGNAERLAETEALVRAEGRQVVAAKADTRDLGALRSVVDSAVSELGGLDAVVANAAICTSQRWDEVTPEVWHNTIATNVTGTWNTCQAALPHIIARGGGSITIVSSAAGITGPPFLLPYVTSKWAIVGLMRALAPEVGKHSVRVNTIHPGGVATAMGDGSHEQIVPLLQAEPELAALYGTLLPSDYRMGPADITPSVVYLASDAAKYVTAVTLPIDQGTAAR